MHEAIRDRILEFMGDNVDYYICPADYDTVDEFKAAVYETIMDGDYMDGDTPEETAIRRKAVKPVLDDIFAETITEEEFRNYREEN